MATYLAVDLGTSFIKGAVLDTDDLTVHDIVRLPFPEALPGLPELHFEVDPVAAVTATRELIEKLATVAPRCAGVVICSQMHGLVLSDDKGTPLSNMITWQDQRVLEPAPDRNASYFDEIFGRISDEDRQRIGNGLKPSLPACALYYMSRFDMLPPAAIPASLPDFVAAHLCTDQAVRPIVVEPTMAASYGLYDVVSQDWRRSTMAKLGIEGLVWPTVVAVDHPAYEARIGDRFVPVFPAIGDHQCALLGALLRERELSLNVSTGSQVSLLLPNWTPGEYEVRPYFDGGYLATLSRIPAGRALNALMDLLLALPKAAGVAVDNPWELVQQAVSAVETTSLRVELSFFASMFGDSGTLRNIREENLSPGHLFRAAFETMAGYYFDASQRLPAAPEWERLVFSGGLAQRFEVLRELTAHEFGLPYRLCPDPEDTLIGLLAVALFVEGRDSTLGAATNRLRRKFAIDD